MSDQTPIEKAREWYLDYYDLHDLAANGLAKDDEQTIEMLAAFDVIVEAQRSPASYAMSRDYSALYDHLCNGGEALGRYLAYEKGPRPALLLSPPLPYTEDGMGRMVGFGDLELDNPEVDMRAEFTAECTRLNLEWLAPVQPLTDEEIEKHAYAWADDFPGSTSLTTQAECQIRIEGCLKSLRERLNKLLKTNERE